MSDIKLVDLIPLVIFGVLILPYLYFLDRKYRKIQKITLEQKLIANSLSKFSRK